MLMWNMFRCRWSGDRFRTLDRNIITITTRISYRVARKRGCGRTRVGVGIWRTRRHRRAIGLNECTYEGKMMSDSWWDIRTLKLCNGNRNATYQVSQSHTNDEVSVFNKNNIKSHAHVNVCQEEHTSAIEERWVFCRSPSIVPIMVAGTRPTSLVRMFLTYVRCKGRPSVSLVDDGSYLPEMFIIIFDDLQFISFIHSNVSFGQSVHTRLGIAITGCSFVVIQRINSI